MAWRKPSSPREWLTIVSAHKAKAFFVALPVMIAVTAVHFEFLHLVPREYFAEAKFERKNDVVIEGSDNQVMASALASMRYAVYDDIRGREPITWLIEHAGALGLTDLLARHPMPRGPDLKLTAEGEMARNDLIARIQRQLYINSVSQTQQFDHYTITYTDETPELAGKTVQALLDHYIEVATQKRTDEMQKNADFYKKQLVTYTSQVSQLDEAKQRFEEDNNPSRVNDPAGAHAKLDEALKKRSDLAAEVELKRAQRLSAIGSFKDMKDEIEIPRYDTNPEMISLRAQEQQLQTEITALRAGGLKDVHPKLVKTINLLEAIKAKIKATPEQVESLKEKQPNLQKMELKTTINKLEGELPVLERQLEAANHNAQTAEALDRNFFAVQRQYRQLERDAADAHEQQKYFEVNLSRTEQAIRTVRAQMALQLRVVQHPDPDIRPSSPSLPVILLRVLGAGLAAAAVVILLAELLNRSYRSVEQATDEIKLPVLGSVNEIVTPVVAWRRRVFNLGLFPAAALALLLVLDASCGLIWLDLHQPDRYARMKHQPLPLVVHSLTWGGDLPWGP